MHNSFARADVVVEKSAPAAKRPRKRTTETVFDEEIYHFTSYVPIEGNVYELDGLQRGPILLGECPDQAWWNVARPAIQERLEKYVPSSRLMMFINAQV